MATAANGTLSDAHFSVQLPNDVNLIYASHRDPLPEQVRCSRSVEARRE